MSLKSAQSPLNAITAYLCVDENGIAEALAINCSAGLAADVPCSTTPSTIIIRSLMVVTMSSSNELNPIYAPSTWRWCPKHATFFGHPDTERPQVGGLGALTSSTARRPSIVRADVGRGSLRKRRRPSRRRRRRNPEGLARDAARPNDRCSAQPAS